MRNLRECGCGENGNYNDEKQAGLSAGHTHPQTTITNDAILPQFPPDGGKFVAKRLDTGEDALSSTK
jgi:hypothetical protein